jgi:hypothetical protein
MKYICIGTLVIAAIGLLYFWPASASIIFGALLLAGYFAWKSYAGSLSAGTVHPTIPKTPVSPLSPVTAPAVPAASNLVTVIEGGECGLRLNSGRIIQTDDKQPRIEPSDLSRNSISAGAKGQQAEPSASARSAAPAVSQSAADCCGEKKGSRHGYAKLADKSAEPAQCADDDTLVTTYDRSIRGVSASRLPVSLSKPRWALTPGTIAKLNEEVVK